jgi:hypothetical protein
MKLEKTFHDEIQQFLKLGWDIKVIPWTAGESSRSKMSMQEETKGHGPVCTVIHIDYSCIHDDVISRLLFGKHAN